MKKKFFSISSKNSTPSEARQIWNDYLNNIGIIGTYEICTKSAFTLSVHEYNAGNFWFNLFQRTSGRESGKPAASMTCTAKDIQERKASGYSIVIAGKNSLFIHQRGKEMEVKPGSILFLNKNEPYKGYSHASESEIKTLNLNEAFIKNWLPAHIFDQSQIISPDSDWARPLSEAMNAIDAPFLDNLSDSDATRFAESMCCLLSLTLQKTASVISSYKSSLLRRLREEIRNRFTDPDFSASDLASSLGLSRRALHATFQAGDLTFRQELLELRLAYAKALLENPENKRASMDEIATQTGFANASYFSTTFKKHVGLSPLAYRKIRLT